MDAHPGSDELAPQLAWTRRLALHLAGGDAARADDLVGDAWLIALQQEQPVGGGFLRRTLQRLAHGARRGEVRRRDHERAAATASQGEAAPDPADVLERAQLLQRLSQAALELEEPFREVILLRYLEERGPAEIAAALDVPLATVRSRLARGLARLRTRFERAEPGANARLSALLVPLAVTGTTPTVGASALPATTATLGLLMPFKLAGLALVAALAGLLWIAFGPEPASPQVSVSVAAEVPPAPADPAELIEPERVPADARSAAEAPEPARALPAEESADAATAPAPAPPAGSSNVLEGVLVVPPEWDWTQADGGELAFEFFEPVVDGPNKEEPKPVTSRIQDWRRVDVTELERLPGFGTRLAWRVDNALDRRCWVAFEALGARWTLPSRSELAAERRTAELVVPPPVELRVSVAERLPDGSAGPELEDVMLFWACPSEGQDSYSQQPAERPAPGQPFQILAPAGRLTLFVHSDVLSTERRELQTEPGRSQDLQILLERTCGVTLRFVDPAGELVQQPFSLSFLSPSIERLSGPQLEGPLVESTSMGDGTVRYTLAAPGRYRYFHVPPEPAGDLSNGLPRTADSDAQDTDGPPPVPYEFEVHPGEFTELDVRADRDA